MKESGTSSPEKRKRLFIIEDSRDFQMVLRQLFEMEGCDVESAYNGKDALDALRTLDELPDLILLDLMMPVMDGFEFREIQKTDPKLSKIPVVIMSAHGDIQMSKKKTGIDDFIRKPSGIDVFLDTVKKYFPT